MAGIKVLAYRPVYRETVRRICCETALRGQPVDPLFPDREVVADLVTRYYTDFEPEATWLAVSESRVVGYLTGCLDSGRYRWLMGACVIPQGIGRAVLRGDLGYPQTWHLAGAALRTVWLNGCHRAWPPAEYPAHLHLNLVEGFRGQRIGEQLLLRFLDHVQHTGGRGVHAAVRGENTSARRFFERMGFVPVGRRTVVLPEDQALSAHETIFYGKRY